jgi:lipopolysaccharide export system protein LptA
MLAGNSNLYAQQPAPAEDTVQKVEILNATRLLTFKTVDDTTKLTIISGDVKLRQGKTLFFCDSCVINNNTNIFEAWGKVHIIDSDTADIKSDHLRYLMKPKVAYLDGNVKLTDGKGVLTTPDLEYEMETNIGIYTHGGRVVNKKTVLTSQEGWYYADLKDIYFKKNVILKDPAYNIVTDSLLYNTETQSTRFISFTTITDSGGRIIKTREGYYNQQTGKAEFGQRPTIEDPKEQVDITANEITTDDSSGISQATGNAIVVDKKNKTTIIAGIIYRNKKTEAIMAVLKPIMIIQQDNDSIYITADTLFSAKLTDLYRSKKSAAAADTIKGIKVMQVNQTDSANRSLSRNDSIATGRKMARINKKDSINLTMPAQKDSLAIAIRKGVEAAEINQKDSTHRDLVQKDSSVTDTLMNDTLFSTHPDTIKDTASTDAKVKDSLKSDTLFMAHPDTIRDAARIDTNVKDSLISDTLFIPHPDISKDTMRTDAKVNAFLSQHPPDPGGSKDSTTIRTAKGEKMIALNENDSTNRYFEAYRNVRIFNDSLQSVCDSMFYSFKDSVFRLYDDPVVWAKESQITGDTILLFTKNKKADIVEAYENSFLVNKLDTQAFNQIKATRMDGYFIDGDIDSVRARGNAECIYYIQDEDSAYTGINQSKSDIMDIYFRNKELYKVVFRSSVTGTLWPIKQKGPSEMKLPNFRWLEDRRPKTKFEMFE